MREPKSILITYNTANDSRSVSGVLKHFLLMARAWIAAGVQVDFLAARAGWPQIHSFVPEAGLISSDNIFNADKYIGKTWAYFPAYGWRMVTAHFTRMQRYDVVIASSPIIFEVYPALVLKRRHGALLAAKFHHVLTAQQKRSGFFDLLFLWSERLAMRSINKHAAVIIASTAQVARDVHNLEASLHLPKRELHQIGYGLDMSLFLAPDSNPVYDVVILGRLHVHKGIFDLPEIWAEVLAKRPGSKLLIIGEGTHRPLLEAGLEKLGVRGSVTLTGGVPEIEKNRLLASSKIGLSLSFEEGWGLSVNECLATGLPVVAYDLPIYNEVFPGLLVAVPAGQKGRVAEELIRLLDDPARRTQLGAHGKQYVQRYDYREIAAAELDAIKKAFRTTL
jgi:glycosyltransferase involved in cell wall biosynthesis